MRQRRGAKPVIRKIVVTAVSGALSYPLTNLLFDSQAHQIVLSAAVGAFALIVQLLVEIDQRLTSVETGQDEHADEVRQVVAEGFRKVSTTTEVFDRIESTELSTDAFVDMARKTAGIGPQASPLVVAFAQSEIKRVTELFGALADSELTREGEDQDYLLALTGLAQHAIDATSSFAVDAGGVSSEGGFWNSDLGHRYLDLQQQRVSEGVRVRRIFIVENNSLTTRREFLKLCGIQMDCGIDVRVLVPAQAPRHREFRDYVLFDSTIGYEVIPRVRIPTDSGNPQIQSTSLTSKQARVRKLVDDYARLWDIALAPGTISRAARDAAASADDPHQDRSSPAEAPA
ncbi:DUF6879 family protein [Kibdelosporangium aridum]|uniref:DUF6879 family protein n=1 Tax=Kibdelosporangium aridum TaxID=2030 RepID=UPI000F783C5B|nr:hypothetical protein [Kibdelosporangium aridum]